MRLPAVMSKRRVHQLGRTASLLIRSDAVQLSFAPQLLSPAHFDITTRTFRRPLSILHQGVERIRG